MRAWPWGALGGPGPTCLPHLLRETGSCCGRPKPRAGAGVWQKQPRTPSRTSPCLMGTEIKPNNQKLRCKLARTNPTADKPLIPQKMLGPCWSCRCQRQGCSLSLRAARPGPAQEGAPLPLPPYPMPSRPAPHPPLPTRSLSTPLPSSPPIPPPLNPLQPPHLRPAVDLDKHGARVGVVGASLADAASARAPEGA